jgi:hypothetical protein
LPDKSHESGLVSRAANHETLVTIVASVIHAGGPARRRRRQDPRVETNESHTSGATLAANSEGGETNPKNGGIDPMKTKILARAAVAATGLMALLLSGGANFRRG